MAVDSRDLSSFGERLLATIDRGRRTGTHKLALLLALLDEVPEHFCPSSGQPPQALPLSAVAHRVLSYMIQQSRPFPGCTQPLNHMKGRQSRLVTAASEARERLGVYDASLRDADDLRVRDVGSYRSAVTKIENKLIEDPLPRLQGDVSDRQFLYQWDWPPGTSGRQVRDDVGGDAEIPLVAGAAEELVRLTPLVRPLIELHYVRDVARYNEMQTVEEELLEYLFGSERGHVTTLVRRQIRKRQHSRCFYADEHHDPPGPTRGPRLVLDHFMPWSRFRLDAPENFVLATESRNRSKSDHLPHARHVVRYLQSARPIEGEVVRVARDRLERTRAVIASAYRAAPLGTPTWVRRSSEGPIFEPLTESARAEILAALSSG